MLLDRGWKDEETGTASVELVAVVPCLLVALLAMAQLIAVGQALWSAGVAARAGARAELVGGDGAAAARRALPAAVRAGAEVEDRDGVAVGIAVPRLFPGMPRTLVRTRASLKGQDG